MRFSMNFGDTNFIGVANADKYKSFVDEDWELDALLRHFGDEMKQGNILVFQMTDEGIEHSWRVDVRVGTEEITHECLRKATGYLQVTKNQLYLLDYDCLTWLLSSKIAKYQTKIALDIKLKWQMGFIKLQPFNIIT